MRDREERVLKKINLERDEKEKKRLERERPCNECLKRERYLRERE